MHKSFKYIVLLMVLWQSAAFSMVDQIKKAAIEGGIIKGSTHYHLISGGKTTVWDRTPEPIEVWNSPQAFFYGYDAQQKENIFLGAVTISFLGKQTIEKLDKLVDPHAKLPLITKATITRCIKRGRIITFYGENQQVIARRSHYNGSIDIKSEENNTGLVKPHSLLNHLQEVREIKPPHWLKALFSSVSVEEKLEYR